MNKPNNSITKADLQANTKASEKRMQKNVDQIVASSEERIMTNVDQIVASSEERIMTNVDQIVASSEVRIMKKVDQIVASSEDRVMIGVGEIIQALITHMDDRFGQVDKQFVALKQELKYDIKQVDMKVNRIDRKLDNTIERTDDHAVRIAKLEKQAV